MSANHEHSDGGNGMSWKRLILAGISIAVWSFIQPLPASAQHGGGGAGAGGGGFGIANPGSSDTVTQRRWIVAGMVTTLGGDPISGATVVVKANIPGGGRKSLRTDIQGRFTTDYWLNVNAVGEFRAQLEAFKKGSPKSYVVVDMRPADRAQRFPITLLDGDDDPTMLSRADLISTLAARLQAKAATAELSPSGRRAYAKGLEEFLDQHHVDQALIPLTDVVRRNPSCLPCRTMLGLAQFDSGDWVNAEHNFTGVIDANEKGESAASPEPLIAYGELESWRHQPGVAAGIFLKALQIAPQDPLALQELGRSQMQLQNWQGADVYLEKALEAGAGAEARFLRTRALLGEGFGIAASKEMASYLNGRDLKTMPVFVRQVSTLIEERKRLEESYAKVRPEDVVRTMTDPRQEPRDLQGLETATDQSPLPSILAAVGKNVGEFLGNFPNTSSLEQVRQEKLRYMGAVGKTRDQDFRYLCFAPTEVWGPTFTEYRLDSAGSPGPLTGLSEGFMLTSGFAATSLLFHPALQSHTVFRYLGRQKLNGRDSFVLAFAQDPAKARSISMFAWGDQRVELFLRGLAWVDTESYQIVRIRTDLLTPLPEISLNEETTDIDLSEVHFNRVAQGFWLPQQVTVTVAWKGRLLRNIHKYSDFKVFQVNSTEKTSNPKQPDSK